MRVLIIGLLATCCALGQTAVIGPQSSSFFYGAQFPNVSFPRVAVSNLGSGDTDLYTVPAGRRALVVFGGGNNTSGSSVTWYAELKIASTYYRLITPVVHSGVNVTGGVLIAIILEAAEKLGVNATGTGLNLSFSVIEFDASSALRTVKLTGPSTGNNILYTAPKSALIASPGGINWNTDSSISFSAGATGGGTVYACSVPSGQAASCGSASAYSLGSGSTSTNTRTGLLPAAGAGISLASGDMLVINVGTGDAAQIAWANVFEF